MKPIFRYTGKRHQVPMVEKQAEAVDVIKMRKIVILALLAYFPVALAQADSSGVAYKKRVLETTEIDFLASYYKQDGSHSAVNGGIGTEKLTDYTSNIVISIPLNADDVLTFDAGFSAYTSASSSNINPFQSGNVNNPNSNTGASKTNTWNKDDDDDYYENTPKSTPVGTPWMESTGASRKDVLTAVMVNYSHSSDDRNNIWNADVSYSKEYDYSSFGFGGGYAKLFNGKNSEISIKGSAYLDKWEPIYPTELHEYSLYGNNFLNSGYFNGVTVVNQFGESNTDYKPVKFKEHQEVKRNSYSVSLGFSQVINKKLQLSVFADLLYQEGLLSTPYHRIYFADKGNYYIGQTRDIPLYETDKNTGVFRLADDVERLPGTRFKVPFGTRLNYYFNEMFVLRTYYRFYADDWGISAHTASIELPVRLSQYFTIFPMYRFYTQVGTDYFAPLDKHYSYQKYYTSDYDLSSFDSHQYGFGASYSDLLSEIKFLRLGIKSIDFRYNHYSRNDNLDADIFSIAIKLIND